MFTDEDFEKLKTKRDKNITIEKFVDIAEVDPIYFDRPYYVNPTQSVRRSLSEKQIKNGDAKIFMKRQKGWFLKTPWSTVRIWKTEDGTIKSMLIMKCYMMPLEPKTLL